jgi:integral membrane protein (TIGR01906 family)
LKDLEFAKIVRWLIVISIPFFLTFVTLRLLIAWNSPSYPTFEYARIPADPYGWTTEQRIDLAHATLDYLRQPESAEEVIHLIEDLRQPGTDLPVYNQREIGHMLDVKEVADTFRNIMWILSILVVVGMVFLLARPETRVEAFKALMHGGLLTAGILLVMLVLILLSWNLVFTQFHEILFPPNTWTFSFTDSLIRLFPEQFWFDFGVLWTAGIFILGLISAAIGYVLLRITG